MSHKGILEAWSEALGEAINEIAGSRFSRLTASLAEGDSAWPVESTFRWPDVGRFICDGQEYTYQGKTPTTLTGVRWQDGVYTPPATGRLATAGAVFQIAVSRGTRVRVVVSGTWAGSLALESSLDGATWTALAGYTALTAGGSWDVEVPGNNLRLRAATLSSGAALVSVLNLSDAGTGQQAAVVSVVSAMGGEVALVVARLSVLRLTLGETWVGTLVLENSADGVAWDTLGTYTSNGVVEVVAPQPRVRVRASAWTSGAATVTLLPLARSGARRAIPVATAVIDTSRTYSALEAIRAQLFVDTAAGGFLDALGRNLGVRRPPDLSDDAAFRRTIKALSYLPKGTMQGLELALTAFFGVGNFEIWEDFASGHHNKVFIRLLNGLGLSSSGLGAGYLARRVTLPYDNATTSVTLPAAGTSPQIDGPPLAMQSARLADEARADAFYATRPSALTDVPYEGATAVPAWAFSGNTAAELARTATGATGLTITTTVAQTAYYSRTLRIRPESAASVGVVVTPTALGGSAAASGKQWCLRLRDGERDVAVGVIADGLGNALWGFVDPSTGQFLTSAVLTTPLGEEVALILKKDAGSVTLWRGATQLQQAYTAVFPATAYNDVSWGHQDATYAVTSVVRCVDLFARTLTDYWNLSAPDGEVSADTLNTNSGVMGSTFVGKAVRTSGTYAKNTGQWVVASIVDVDSVVVTGPTQHGATVQSTGTGGTGPHLVTVANDGNAFVYPYDVGKKLEILTGDPALGNNGVYVIANLRRATSPTTVISGSGVEHTNVVELASAPVGGFDAEANLQWRLVPNFQTDPVVFWEMADAGTVAGRVATLRGGLPLTLPVGYVAALEVGYSTVHSAQVLPSADVSNTPSTTWFPWYLGQHPLGPYASYLKDLTVAGVIPDVSVPAV